MNLFKRIMYKITCGNLQEKPKKVNLCLLFWRNIITLVCWIIGTLPATLLFGYKPTWWGKGLPFNKISRWPRIRIPFIDKEIPIIPLISVSSVIVSVYILFEPLRAIIYFIISGCLVASLVVVLFFVAMIVAVILVFLIAAFIGLMIYGICMGIAEEIVASKWWPPFKARVYKFYKKILCPDISFENIQ